MDASIFHKQVDDFIYNGTTFLKSNQYVIEERIEERKSIKNNPFALMKAGKPSYTGEQTEKKRADVSIEKNNSEEKQLSTGDKAILTTVYFAFDEYNISPEGYEKLKEIVLNYKDKEKPALKIIGYTDHVGTKEYNDMLALKRAMAVAGYFKVHGFDTVVVEGKGSCCFKETGELSRRAEIEIFDRKGNY